MKEKYAENLGIKDGIIAGLPIVIGYFPIAMTFGILSKTTGISIIDSSLFSILVYAGASQFMALNLLHMGAGIGEIVLTTLLVNFRHFLMSASLASRVTKDMKKWSPVIAFGITDEVFSVAAFRREQITTKFILSLDLVSYLSWIMGTVFGYLIGQVLPSALRNSMGVALYAMFAAILIPEAKKSKNILILAILSGLINTLLYHFMVLPQGWNLILAIISVSALGALIFKEKEVSACE